MKSGWSVVGAGLTVFVGCGSRASIELPPGALSVEPAAVDVGGVDCGASAELTVRLSNDESAGPLHWAAHATGAFALLGRADGTLHGHESHVLAVRASVPTSTALGGTLEGSLTIDSDDPSHPRRVVPLRARATGYTLSIPELIDVGDVPLGKSAPPLELPITNSGTSKVSATIAEPTNKDFAISPAKIDLAGGASGAIAVSFEPSAWAEETATADLQVTGAYCGPTRIQLRGRGTKGSVLVSPGALDFGPIACGASASPKSFTVRNLGDASFSFTTSNTGNFDVSPSTAVVAPGQMAKIVVTPAAVPVLPSSLNPGALDGIVDVMTDALGDSIHTVTIRQGAIGAVVDVSSPDLGVLVDEPSSGTITVSNSGNVAATVSATSPLAGMSFGPVTVGAGMTQTITVHAAPDLSRFGEKVSVPYTITTSEPMCNAPASAPSVELYDRAIDVDSMYPYQYLGGLVCVVGHTHRLYCRGSGAPAYLGLPNALTKMTAIATNVDRVTLREFVWLTRGQQVVDFKQPNITLQFGLGQTIAPGGWPQSTCAISSGDVYCAGQNTYGQFGNGLIDFGVASVAGPAMTTLHDVVEVVGGQSTTCAVRANGHVACAGSVYGLSDEFTGAYETVPRELSWVTDATHFSLKGIPCASRSGGGIRCKRLTTFDVGGINDATNVLSEPAGIVCATRPGGTVFCAFAGSSFPPPTDYSFFAGPVVQLAGWDRYTLMVRLQDGRVQSFSPFAGILPTTLDGFDVP